MESFLEMVNNKQLIVSCFYYFFFWVYRVGMRAQPRHRPCAYLGTLSSADLLTC